MPSSKALTNVHVGAGKLHPNVASAAADFDLSAGAEGLIATMVAALNQEIAVPTYMTMYLLSGATSITIDGSLYGPLWMGNSGEVAKDLFDVVSLSDDLRVSDAVNYFPIYVTGVSGASVGSGSFTTNTITLNLSAALPSDGNYRVLFSKRSTIGSFQKGAMATARRFVPEPAAIENAIYWIKWNTSGLGSWDASPVCSLRTLALAGLNERYNRSALDPGGSPVIDGPGDGHLIHRGGPAVTIEAQGNQRTFAFRPPDPYWAHYLTTAGSDTRSSNYAASYDGGSGFVGILQQKLTTSAGELKGASSMTVASRMDLIERDITATAIGTGVIKTKVNTFNATGTALNPDAGVTDDAQRTIRLGTGDYFWESTTGSDLSEVAIGHDMIEMTLGTGEVYIYVITKLFGGPHPSSPVPAEDQRRALVRDLTGGLPGFPSGVATTGVKFRFIKTKHFQGVGTQALRAKLDAQPDPVHLGYHYEAVTPPLTSNPGATGSDEYEPKGFEIYAPGRTKGHDFLRYSPIALAWGGHDAQSHEATASGFLRGDGAVECSLVNRKVFTQTYTTTGIYGLTWHPSLEGSVLFIDTSHPSSYVDVTLSLDTDFLNNVLKEGDEITIITKDTNASGRQLIMHWPASFRFSGAEDQQPWPDVEGFSKYHGIYLPVNGGTWFMTVTCYMGAGA